MAMKLNKIAIITIFAAAICASCNFDGYITDGKDYGASYYRPATIDSNPYCTKAFEYTPAPGQFINETKTGGFDGTQTTAEAACAYAVCPVFCAVFSSVRLTLTFFIIPWHTPSSISPTKARKENTIKSLSTSFKR